MLLEKWTPLRDLDVFDRRTRRFFEDLGFAPTLAPAADVYETDDELVVELEVPGFDTTELEIDISDHTLCVKGERKELSEKQESTIRMRERLTTEFERRFMLPPDVDTEHVTATYGNGVLTLVAPKSTVRQPRTIEIANA